MERGQCYIYVENMRAIFPKFERIDIGLPLGKIFSREDIFAEDIFANRGSLSCEFCGRYSRESRIESQFRGRYFREIRIEGQFREKYFRDLKGQYIIFRCYY